ncbi:uncharacterized protein LOC144946022 [Lampetra fluviatilis]
MCAEKLAAPESSSPVCAHPAAATVAVTAGKGKSGGYTRLNKPAASYTALIATAIQDSPQKKLTLLEIIGRLQQQYECFTGAYKGWKNSVRHTLSVNKCFVKVPRDASRPYAKDNFWTLAAVDDYVNADGTFRPRRRRAGKRRGASDECGRGSPDSGKSASPSRRSDGRAPSGSHDDTPPPPPPASGSPGGQSSAKFSGPFSIESLLQPSKGEAQAAVVRARRAFAFAGAETRWDAAAFGLLAHERARLALADTLGLLPLHQQQRSPCSCPWPAASELPCGCQVTYPGTRAEGAAFGFASAAAYMGMPMAFSSSGNFSQPVC